MKVPALTGLIKRRLLVNYRIDPDAVQRLLPKPLRPKRCRDYAIGGICLIRLEGERPAGLPRLLGASSENAAHRFAVEWTSNGEEFNGVYVPRRDTDSVLNRLAGGRLFASEYHGADFRISDQGGHIDYQMRSHDGEVAIRIVADDTDEMAAGSLFASLEEASDFFEAGAKGYSPSAGGDRHDGIELVTDAWKVRPLAVSHVETQYFQEGARFPEGSVEFDNALIMRDIPHEWRQIDNLPSA